MNICCEKILLVGATIVVHRISANHVLIGQPRMNQSVHNLAQLLAEFLSESGDAENLSVQPRRNSKLF